jgi:hypothetical protein
MENVMVRVLQVVLPAPFEDHHAQACGAQLFGNYTASGPGTHHHSVYLV